MPESFRGVRKLSEGSPRIRQSPPQDGSAPTFKAEARRTPTESKCKSTACRAPTELCVLCVSVVNLSFFFGCGFAALCLRGE
jgi:hypothetical protein